MDYADAPEFSDRSENEAKLMMIERQFGWHAEEWHRQMAAKIDEPIKVYAWLGTARKVGDKIYLNAADQRHATAYDYIPNHLKEYLLKAFGNLTICLAMRGQVVRSYKLIEPKTDRKVPKARLPYAEALV